MVEAQGLQRFDSSQYHHFKMSGCPWFIGEKPRLDSCGYSIKVMYQPSKLSMRVRFPLSAPFFDAVDAYKWLNNSYKRG